MSYLKKLSCLALVLALAVPASADLVMHLEFDNPSQIGEATVGDDLMAVGDAQYTAAGINGGGLLLDGDGDYLQLDVNKSLPSDIPTGNSSFTVAAYFKTTNGGVVGDATSGKNGIIGWGMGDATGRINGTRTGYHAGAAGTYNHVQNYSWGAGYDCVGSETNFADGEWHHVAAVYDSATLTKVLYFDGVNVGSLTMPAALDVAPQNFLVGAIYYVYNGDKYEHFTGTLDDVRIYDSVITEAEAAEIRAVAEPVPEPSVLLSLLALVSYVALAWRRR